MSRSNKDRVRALSKCCMFSADQLQVKIDLVGELVSMSSDEVIEALEKGNRTVWGFVLVIVDGG